MATPTVTLFNPLADVDRVAATTKVPSVAAVSLMIGLMMQDLIGQRSIFPTMMASLTSYLAQ
jgi:hypothetical protein